VTHADYRPDRATFAAQAADHPLVPVWRDVLADLHTPAGVYDRVRDLPGATFLLESVEQGERWGRYSFVGCDPLLEVRGRAGDVRLSGAAPAAARQASAAGDPLATVQALLEALAIPTRSRAGQGPASLPPLFAGLVGYVGYDLVRLTEPRVPDTAADDLGLDDLRLALPRQLVAFDHRQQTLTVVVNVLPSADADADYDAAVAAGEALVARLAEPPQAASAPPPWPEAVDDAASTLSREAYLDVVAAAKAHIAAGECFQIVPSQRFTLETDADPFAVYRVLRRLNPSPYLFCIEWDDAQLVGSSPEALVTLRDDTAHIWPIAGSRARGSDDAADAQLEAELRDDPKETAEHVMLVDLARNDLGRVCELGTVRVEELMDVVRYSHIMHLESRVAGGVRHGVDAVGLLRATFPAGTLTGTPKVRAMEILDDLEPTRRGPYGGGVGYFDLGGDMDLCIAIRTLVFARGRAHVQAGGGVVADSEPAAELEETRRKAMALLSAVRAAERLTVAERASPASPAQVARVGS
jgi:anthranilate synthase component 1